MIFLIFYTTTHVYYYYLKYLCKYTAYKPESKFNLNNTTFKMIKY